MSSLSNIGDHVVVSNKGNVSIGWTSNSPVSVGINIQGAYQSQFGTGFGAVDVQYYDPNSGQTVHKSFVLGPSTTRINVITGVPVGSPLASGEVVITMENAPTNPATVGAPKGWAGSFGVLGWAQNAVRSLAESPFYQVVLADMHKIVGPSLVCTPEYPNGINGIESQQGPNIRNATTPDLHKWDNGDSPSEQGPGPGVTGGKPTAEEEKDPNEAFDADEFSDKKAGDVTTPVIIDLSPGGAATQASDGLPLIGLYNSPVFYNSDNDKFKERTAWVGPNEGIVVFTEKDGAVKDINGDGKITVAEIALTKVVNNTKTDMEALYKGFDKGYDTNNDGVVDKGANDHKIEAAEADAWGLRIWRDANVNGVIDANEMMTFAAAGIDSIDLNDTNIDELKDHAKEGSKARADDIIGVLPISPDNRLV